MKKNGFTLVEVVVSIALIALIAVFFLPFMTFSYTNLIYSKKFTNDMFKDQAAVETQINAKRIEAPNSPNKKVIEFFDVNIDTHDIQVNTSSSGQVHVFVPKQTLTPLVPVVNVPKIIIRNNSDKVVNLQPPKISLLGGIYTLFVDEVTIKSNPNEHLMNVYRWYTTGEVSESYTPSNKTSDYLIVHEWNEARMQVPFETALPKNFIPNFKEYVDPVSKLTIPYNRLNYSAIKNYTGLVNEEMINRFGNRYVVYGVTPYSLSGQMGAEQLSNAIYVEAPRIIIESAKFDSTKNAVIIKFQQEVKESYNKTFFSFNTSMGEILGITKYQSDSKSILVEFKNKLDKTGSIKDNYITRGGVESKDYGAITIWSNNEPNAAFTITP